jgi:hypothetical protein
MLREGWPVCGEILAALPPSLGSYGGTGAALRAKVMGGIALYPG